MKRPFVLDLLQKSLRHSKSVCSYSPCSASQLCKSAKAGIRGGPNGSHGSVAPRPNPTFARGLLLALAFGLSLGAAQRPSVFVAYPPPQYEVQADHILLEGSVTPGSVLRVNGQAAATGTDGLFILWWPLKPGGQALRLTASNAAGTSSTVLRLTRRVPLPATPTRILPQSVRPNRPQEFWDWAGENPADRAVEVRFTGSAGGAAWAGWPTQTPVPLRERPAGEYSGRVPVPAGATSAQIRLQLRGPDGKTAQVMTSPISLTPQPPQMLMQRLGTVPGRGLNDAVNVVTTLEGQPLLYPRDGMTFRVVGRQGDDLRVRLALGKTALVSASQLGPVLPVSFAAPPLGELAVNIPLLAERPPFHVTQTAPNELQLTVYGELAQPVAPVPDPLLSSVTVAAPQPGVNVVTLRYASHLWGFSAGYGAGVLTVSVRRPPAIDAAAPLRGRIIMLDAGHGGDQWGGAGALRVPEKDLVLPITLRAAELLQQQGATVYLTRQDDRTLGLYERGQMAEMVGAELLVSIHANALPDGRSPVGIRGPEVYFSHPQAQAPAAAILQAIRARLPELGAGAGLKPGANLALTRPTTQPSVLVETGYLTDPANLRSLMSPQGQEKLAQAIAAGIGDFFRAQVQKP